MRNRRLADLLADTARGDPQAFRALYDLASPKLYGLALQLMRSSAAADDVLQDAFVQIWHRAGDYHRERGSVLAWLSSIVRYRAIDALRRTRNDAPIDDDTLEASVSNLEPSAAQLAGSASGDRGRGPMADAIADDDARHVKDCLSRLSASQKQSVALAFFHGMTHQELADRLAQPLGTIKSRLRRGLQRLKECLKELGYGNEIFTRTG
ncbi:MAG: sigma-70 family RNA polymerase sigma factor [Woeseiaceae bacterium]|nr:sigma-70 family RNA polymerase sigma factor [Woeseiaceae bacterium]